MRQLPERPIKTQNESVTLTPIKAPTAIKTPPFSNVIRIFIKFIKLNKVALPSATFSNRKRQVELAQDQWNPTEKDKMWRTWIVPTIRWTICVYLTLFYPQ